MDEYTQAKQSLYFKRFTRTAGSFETALWDLFDKADDINKVRIGAGFPAHYRVYMDWFKSPGEREFFSEYINE